MVKHEALKRPCNFLPNDLLKVKKEVEFMTFEQITGYPYEEQEAPKPLEPEQGYTTREDTLREQLIDYADYYAQGIFSSDCYIMHVNRALEDYRKYACENTIPKRGCI